MTFKSSLRIVSQAVNHQQTSRNGRRSFTSPPTALKTKPSSSTRKPSPWTQSQLSPPRHLLRAILRECTYLPDPHARTYLRLHALARFRAYTLPNKPLAVLEERRHGQIKQARKALSELRRANAGELKVLTKVLHLTYGRIGKRRHELLDPLLVPEDAATISDTSSPATDDHAGNTTLPTLTTKLKALLISQLRSSPPEVTRAHPKTLAPKIPDKNTWERPMPQVRVKNFTKQWYAKLLSRTMPPLDTKEWDQLKDRATGKLAFEGPRKRRPQGTSALYQRDVQGREALEKELAPHTRHPEDVLERVDEKTRGRNLTKRFMRKRWAAVFAQCASMDWDDAEKRWNVKWGVDVLINELKLMSMPESVSKPSDQPVTRGG